MAQTRVGKVFVLALVPPEQTDLLATPAEHVKAALAAGANTTRYGREWLIGGTTSGGGRLSGRIGYKGAEGIAEVWDDKARDFRPTAIPQGQAVPFTVDLTTLRLAVQTRGSNIKLLGLIGAFQALLSSDGQRWTVRSPRRAVSFAVWRASVDKVTLVRLKVRKPNPSYRDTPDIEALLEQSASEVATMTLRSDAGVDTSAPFVAQSQHHIERGYGEAVYVGVKSGVSAGGETVYNTAFGGEELSHDADVDANGEVSTSSLVEAMEREQRGLETGTDGLDGQQT